MVQPSGTKRNGAQHQSHDASDGRDQAIDRGVKYRVRSLCFHVACWRKKPQFRDVMPKAL
jgi:hypothetical protein